MLVYLIVNKVNGKGYVGQTTRDVAKRWREHCLLQGKCRVLENAIRKYGVEAFEVSVVASVQTQEELNRLERLTCEALNTYAPHGYNLQEGGGAKGKMHEQTKRIIGDLALRPERLAAFRETRSRPEVREKMRQAFIKDGAKRAADTLSGRTPESEVGRLEALRNTWAKPEVRQAQSIAQREAQARPEVRAKRSASLTASWASVTDEQRAARGAAISRGTTGVKKTISQSPEAKAARSAVATRTWQSPQRQAKHAARFAELLADPEFLKRRGEAIAAALAEKRGTDFFEQRAAKHAETWAKRAAAQTHCKHGHELTDENTFTASGKRRCAVCRRDTVARFKERQEASCKSK